VGNVIAGKYVIERVIGVGGLGVVVAAKHIALEQSVAIKYLLPAAQMTPTFVERFIREARLAASIKSEHVARVYDVATHECGVPYIVMEHLVGRDLRSLLEEGPIPTPDAVDFLLQACEALAEAHRAGIVHRDLKPDNFFLASGPGGRASIKLLDFGISKMTFAGGDSGNSRQLTGNTDRFGTPDYMSPEHLRATASVDARADVWSLGVVLFECLTGKVPFEGSDFPQLCVSILTSPPLALHDALPEAPPELEAVIARCLEKEPEKRFQNIGELAEALAPYAFEDSARHVAHIRRVIDGSTSQPRVGHSGPRLSYSDGALRSSARTASRGGATSSGAVRAVSAVDAVGAVAVVPAETTRTAMELRDPKPKRARSAVVLASTALLFVGLGVAILVLRVKADHPPALAPVDTSEPRAAQAAADTPRSTPPAPPSVPSSVETPAPQATVSAIAAPPAAATSAPTLPATQPAAHPTATHKSPAPGKTAPAASSAKRPAPPVPTFDPGGVVNPFQ
jgi:serine/threonine protein kinase